MHIRDSSRSITNIRTYCSIGWLEVVDRAFECVCDARGGNHFPLIAQCLLSFCLVVVYVCICGVVILPQTVVVVVGQEIQSALLLWGGRASTTYPTRATNASIILRKKWLGGCFPNPQGPIPSHRKNTSPPIHSVLCSQLRRPKLLSCLVLVRQNVPV